MKTLLWTSCSLLFASYLFSTTPKSLLWISEAGLAGICICVVFFIVKECREAACAKRELYVWNQPPYRYELPKPKPPAADLNSPNKKLLPSPGPFSLN